MCSSVSIIYQYDFDSAGKMRFLNVSPEASALIGVTPHALMNDSGLLLSRVHPEDQQVVVESLKQSSLSRRIRHLRYRVFTHEGLYRWIEVKATPQYIERGMTIWNGAIHEILETGHDRGYRLDQARMNYARSDLSNSLFMTWLRRPDGKLTWVSPDFRAFLGATISPSPDTAFVERIHPKDIGLYLQNWRKTPQYAYQFEYRLRRYDDDWRWIIEQGNIYRDEDGKLAGFVGYCLDINAYKSLENDFATADDLHTLFMRHEEQKLLAERKQIAQLLHDDIGQMLTAAKLQAFALQSQPGLGAETVTAVRELGALIQQTQQSLRLATTMINPPYARHGDLIPAIQEMVRRLQGSMEARMELEVVGLDKLPETLTDDESLVLFRFVQEAVTNAVRHAQAGKIDILLAFRRGVLKAEVSDDGKGFAVDQLGFNIGLGLSGMRERASMIRADFSLTSEPGKGTRLVMALKRFISTRKGTEQ